MDEDKILEMHDAIIQIKTVLLGANGDKGMVGEQQEQREKLRHLSKCFWLLVGLLCGSGIISVTALIEAL